MDTNKMFEQSHMQQDTSVSHGVEELSDRELDEINGGAAIVGADGAADGFIGTRESRVGSSGGAAGSKVGRTYGRVF